MRQGTALDIIKQAAAELGLPVPVQAVTSSEVNNVQMVALLNGCGADLQDMYDWQFALRTADIIGVAGQSNYPRPADFLRQINQSIWDKTNMRPVQGPVSPQGWSWISNYALTVGPFVRYRVHNGVIQFVPTPAENAELNYQYISKYWVQDSLDPIVFKDRITHDADVVLFDFWLVVKYLKVKMWAAKGLDTSTLAGEFSGKFDSLTGQDKGAPVLSLAPRVLNPFISTNNVPDGNWQVM